MSDKNIKIFYILNSIIKKLFQTWLILSHKQNENIINDNI
jgi:hypothetical protein